MIYTLRIYKQIEGKKADGQWSNTYHISTELALDSPEMAQKALGICGVEYAFHTSDVEFDRAVISTYKKDSDVPGIPPVRVLPLGVNGNRQVTPNAEEGENALPPDIALVIRRSGVLGRSGLAYYRGVLTGPDWQYIFGAFNVQSTIGTDFAAALKAYCNKPDFLLVIPHTKPEVEPVVASAISEVKPVGIRARDRNARRRRKATVAV